MKELRWKFFWCLLFPVLGLLLIGIAWYNYSNPPLRLGPLTTSRVKFKLGVDLVGGTILVYEIDPDKQQKEYNKDQLISALKKRLDPADLFNITIRPLSDTRIEIILPTGGRQQLEAQNAAWAELLAKAGKKWDMPAGTLKAKRGEVGQLTDEIKKASATIPGEEITKFIAQEYGDTSQRELTGDDVERIKELVSRVGSLEFRILANTKDDKQAIDIALKDFDTAAKQWAEILTKVREKYPLTDKEGPKEEPESTRDLTLGRISAGDDAGLASLILARYPSEDIRAVARWLDGLVERDPALVQLTKRASSGVPPPSPIGPDGLTFRIRLNDSDRRVSYSWKELGPSELHTLHLDMASRSHPNWQQAAIARAAGKPLFLVGTGEGYMLTPSEPARLSSLLFSRKITNPGRISKKDQELGKVYEYFLLTRDAEEGKAVTGEHLTSASETSDKSGGMAVGFNFNSKGAALFYDLTSSNVSQDSEKRNLAIVLDGLIMSAPTLNEAIRDSGQISGKFTRIEVDNLINILRSGALPATLKPQPVSENTMGATLGDDTIRAGMWSIGISFAAVLLFMVVYYRFAGVVACVALLANLILTVAFMVSVSATFTLPGLAGLVLMLAMAVDANILIYERLREERDRGASLSLALRNGYDRAFPTIIDTHLSSIFTAIVLYVVGNDQLKGFGISLTVGLLISLFTSLYMTKVIFRLWELKGWLKKLSMARLLTKTRIDFMGIRKPVFVASVSLALLGLVLFLSRGKSSLNMDFVGGTVYSGELADFIEMDKLRDAFAEKEQQKKLALESDPRPTGKENEWELTYREPDSSGNRTRTVFITDSGKLAPAEVRARVESLPEPTLEMIYVNDDNLTRADTSKLFTVRTTEKAAELVSAAVARLLDDKLVRVNLDPKAGYTLSTIQLQLPEKATLNEGQLRALLLPALKQAKVIDSDDGVKFIAKDRNLALDFKSPVDGKKLLETVLPLAAKEKLTVLVDQADLNLTGYAYRSQVQNLLKNLSSQEVSVVPVDENDERDNRYNRMRVQLPGGVEGGRFKLGLDNFGVELANRPPPVRLENFDSALAAEMQERAIYAIVASWGAMLLYLWFRFGNWTFGLAAVLCLIHDVCMTLGAIAVCHYLYEWFPFSSALGVRDFKLDLPAVASLLTLIGFSVNDTIVVFDRIREVRGKNPHLTPEMINESVNQTLSRTILTSLTAWLVVLVLFIWGGEGVHLFAFVMVFGVVIGTYSSIFIASPLLLLFGEGAPRAGAPQPGRPREELTAPQEG